MNSPVLVRILSVAVLGLSALVVYQGRQLQTSTPQSQPAATGPVGATPHSRVTTPAAAATPTPTPAPRTTPFHWRNVESSDYGKYIANLRAIGCPEQTIRDIVIADVNKLFVARRAERITGGRVPPYWQTVESLPAAAGARIQQQLLELDREKTSLIRDLLGVDLATELRKSREGVTYPENRHGFLSEEKQDLVSAVREEMNEKWALLQPSASREGKTPDEISAELRKLNEDRLARLAQILTPEELREHELQTSWTAINLRNQLAAFQPSSAEFTAVYDLQKAFDDAYVHYYGSRNDEPALQRKELAQQQLEAQIRSQLGEQRYADYLAAKAGSHR